MMPIIKRSQVLFDLLDQARYIARDNPDAARRFLLAAEDTFADILANPQIGRVRRLKNPLFHDLRQWPVKGFKNYLVYYQVSDEEITVLRVMHSARDISTILNLEP